MAGQVALGDGLDDDLAAEPVDVVQHDDGGLERVDRVDRGVQSGAVEFGARVGIVKDADDGVAAIGAVAAARLVLRGQAVALGLFVARNSAR